MRRKVFSIWSVLLVLVVSTAVLVPGCVETTPEEECNINVEATFQGSVWTGVVQYTLNMPGATAPPIINGTSVPTTHSNVEPGSWTCTYVSGGPGVLLSITPSSDQGVTAGGTITFTLNFATETLLNHFMCYDVTGETLREAVHLEDQFDTFEAVVSTTELFCNPVEKWHDGVFWPIWNSDYHLTLYSLITEFSPQEWFVDIYNQFGQQRLRVSGPILLGVPTQQIYPKDQDPPEGLDYFLIYDVIEWTEHTHMNNFLGLYDQWSSNPAVQVMRAYLFANPVRIGHDGEVINIKNQDVHLVFYGVSPESYMYETAQIFNRFGYQTIDSYDPVLLAVASEKIDAEPAS